MPRKKFEETPYDPIRADLVREVVQTGPLVSTPLIAAERAGIRLAPPVGPEVDSVTKRFILNRAESEDLEAFLLRVQKQAGAKVTLSMFIRALLNVVMQAEPALLAQVSQGRPRRFPSTHDSIAQGVFEDWWMRSILNAVRTLPQAPMAARVVESELKLSTR